MALSSLGAIVVPLNFQLTSREIAFIVKDAQMKHSGHDGKIGYQNAELIQHDYSVKITQLILPEFAAIFAVNHFESAPSFDNVIAETGLHVLLSIPPAQPAILRVLFLTHKNLISNLHSFGCCASPRIQQR